MCFKSASHLIGVACLVVVLIQSNADGAGQDPCEKAIEFRNNVAEVSREVANIEKKLGEQVAQFESTRDEKDKLKETIAEIREAIRLNRQQIKEVAHAAREADKRGDKEELAHMRQKLTELKAEEQSLATQAASLSGKLKTLNTKIKPIKAGVERLKRALAKNTALVQRYQAQHERHKAACQKWHAQGCPTKSKMERLGQQRFSIHQLAGPGVKSHCEQIKDFKAKDVRCKPAILPPICTDICANRIEGYIRLFKGLDRARQQKEALRKEVISNHCPRLKLYVKECPFDAHPLCI